MPLRAVHVVVGTQDNPSPDLAELSVYIFLYKIKSTVHIWIMNRATQVGDMSRLGTCQDNFSLCKHLGLANWDNSIMTVNEYTKIIYMNCEFMIDHRSCIHN